MVLTFSENEVRIYLARSKRGGVFSYGIEFNGLLFNNDELAMIRRHTQVHRHHANGADQVADEKFDEKGIFYKYDPSDLGCIWVLDPIANIYVEVPCTFPEYAKGMTLRRHLLNLQYAKTRVKDVVDEQALAQAHQELSEMIRNATVHDAERLGKAFARAALVAEPARPPNAPEGTNAPFPDDARLSVDPSKSTTGTTPTPATTAASHPEVEDSEIDSLAASWTKN
jgi:hypothetical protein